MSEGFGCWRWRPEAGLIGQCMTLVVNMDIYISVALTQRKLDVYNCTIRLICLSTTYFSFSKIIADADEHLY